MGNGLNLTVPAWNLVNIFMPNWLCMGETEDNVVYVYTNVVWLQNKRLCIYSCFLAPNRLCNGHGTDIISTCLSFAVE